MAENETELSEEELLALSEGSKEDLDRPINASGNSPVLSHDLAMEIAKKNLRRYGALEA